MTKLHLSSFYGKSTKRDHTRCSDCKAKRTQEELKQFNGLCVECYYEEEETK